MQSPNGLRNMERMEESVPDVDYDQLQHFISKSTWDHEGVMDEVSKHANELIGGHRDSCLIIDETSFPKKGDQSAGVARQWCGRLGKIDNCQVGVFTVLGCGNHALPIGAKLYLPEEWCSDEERCEKAGIPNTRHQFQTKSEQALELVKRARHNGVELNWIAADGVYGGDTTFLRNLDDIGETFVMDVRSNQCVFLEDPDPKVPPAPPEGRPTTIKRSNKKSVRVDDLIKNLSPRKWRRVKIRSSTKGIFGLRLIRFRVDMAAKRAWTTTMRPVDAHCHAQPRNEGRHQVFSLKHQRADLTPPTGFHATPAILDRARFQGGQVHVRPG